MEIIGLGMDATEIDRIAHSIERYGDHFLRRVFTEGEIAYCRRKRDSAPSFAARFAAKEAGNEGARHGFLGGRLRARHRGLGAGGPAATAVSWRRRRPRGRDGQHFV